jgi:hypothetical protein
MLTKRRAITSARIGETPVEASEGMRMIIEQLVQVLAPVVREISAHSLSPDELVLRRMMGDDRREEIFISKSELRASLDGLGEADRRLFDPLELEVAGTATKSLSPPRASESPRGGEVAPPGAPRARVNGSTRPPPPEDLTARPRE